MKKLSGMAIVIAGTMLLSGAAFSTSAPNTTTPLTDVGPTIKASFTNRLVENNAYSLQGELGARNLRFNATYGWKFTERQRLKVTGEYLWQYINYAFYSGNTNTWVSQVAVGVDYQQDLAPDNFLRPQLDIGVYGSHAPSKALGDINGSLNNSQGLPYNYTDERRVAGSNGRGVSPGVTIIPWPGSRLTTTLNYDHIHYNAKYNVLEEDADGFGGTVSLNQALNDYTDLGLSAAVRQPFNNYNATVLFTRVPMLGIWAIGVFAEYTNGKNTLPDTYNFGVTANYLLDQSRDDYIPVKARRISEPVTDMLAYVAIPAVYMPQVLAIPDNKTVQNCALAAIQYTGAPGADPGLPVQITAFTFSFAPFFTGPNILYSLSVVASDGGSASDFSINPNSGLLSYAGTVAGGIYILTVTGANACSNASVTFTYNNT